MTRQLAFLVLVIISISSGFTQNSSIKLIEKENFLKAEKKISKALLKTPDDVGLNYTMSVLLTERGYEGYNPVKSYEFLMKSMKLYQVLTDEKELKSLNKIPINDLIFHNTLDTICRCALEDALTQNKIEIYEEYLNYYKSAHLKYQTVIIEKRDILAYEIAIATNTAESYQNFITNYPKAIQINNAIKNRDIAAYKATLEVNTVESYQSFISKYPKAIQISEAINKRNALEYETAKKADNIDKFKEFTSKYPNANETSLVWKRIHELAFNQAEKLNTSFSYKRFIDEYPKSEQYSKATALYEQKQFLENVSIGDWMSYRSFIANFPNNTWISAAQDSVFKIGVSTLNQEILSYCVDNFTGSLRDTALISYHDVFTNDGEKETLDLFYDEFEDVIFNEIKVKDYELAELGNELKMHLPYNSNEFSKYDEYIQLAAPREKAFVALQRIISHDIAIKDWPSAIKKANKYLSFFGDGNKKMSNLISVLGTTWDNTIKINSVGNGINSVKGGEYVPVISADDKLMYFCGRERDDNIGGEDIFVSKKINDFWGTSKIVSALSSQSSNNAPLSVSTDGTMMLLFKSGKLYYSEKTSNGWSEETEFSENINSASWQADAMISSDGKALIFSSIKEGGFNIFHEISVYHGDNLYPADIYVSTLNEQNEWSEPANLGPVINTPYCDRSPFLHPDMKTIYFSSDGHGGLGKLDVYKSTRLADTCWNCWSEPINMGKEINTEESDWGYRISTDGEKAFFSKKNSAKEDENIYWLNLPKHLRPDLVATISGKLLDNQNRPVTAEIRWENLETGENVGQSKSDPSDGSFFIVLPLGKIYGYFVDKGDFFPASANIDLRTNTNPVKIEADVNLTSFKQMIDDGTAVPVNNLFFNFAESTILDYSIPELTRVASIIKSNKLNVELSGHTDIIGDDEQNQLLSEKRAEAVKNFLITKGCSPESLFTIGYGRSKPVASNETEVGRAKNRRVELRFIR